MYISIHHAGSVVGGCHGDYACAGFTSQPVCLNYLKKKNTKHIQHWVLPTTFVLQT